MLFSLALVAVLGLTIVILRANGADLGFNGFATDRAGRLFLGKTEQIEVLQGEEIAFTIPTGKHYAFTIRNGYLHVTDAETVKIMDLSGNTVTQAIDDNGREYDTLAAGRERFTNAEGTTYVRKHSFFTRDQILNEADGSPIYTLPVKDYCLRLSYPLLALSALLLIWNVLRYFAKRK